MIETITGVGLLITALAMLGVGGYFGYYFLNKNIQGKLAARTKEKAAAVAKRTTDMRNSTDYFWKESMTFSWIVIGLIFFIILGFVTGTFLGLFSSIIFIIIAIFFGIFAYKSYDEFETKAKAKLTEFENTTREGIHAEISFNGDNIQSFSDEDDAFDTKPTVFEFPTGVTKIAFPPLEKNAKNHKIVSTKKLEFLILSREYFSICQGAGAFNLLSPKKPGGGECDEFYYSQMQNVLYDAKEKCIRIIYHSETKHGDVIFPCAKPAAKAPMKALKEKLRLTERQKLQKIQEHKNYEDIKDKRVKVEENKKEETK